MVITNDLFFRIPFACIIVSASIVLFLNLKNKYAGSIFRLLSTVVLAIAGASYFIFPNVLIFSILVAISTILLIPAQLSATKQMDTDNNEKQKELVQELLTLDTDDEFHLDPDTAQTKVKQQHQQREEELLVVSRDFMIHAADAFSDETGLVRLLDYINTNLIKETKADGGAILLVDDFEDVIAVKAFTGSFPPPYKLPSDVPHKLIRVETNFRFSQFSLGDTIFGIIASSGKAELITNPSADSRIYQNGSEDFLKCGSYIFVPMILKDTVIGVVSLARKATSPVFTEEDFIAAKVLTDFASAAIKNVYSFQEIVEHAELTREAEIACKFQRSIQPTAVSIPGISFGHFFNGAEGVCGDYFDVIPSRKDRIAFVCGDIAGKGMNSLVVMIMLRAILQLIVNTTQSAATILAWVNRGITGKINIDHFASLSLINYNGITKKVEFSTAGNNPLYIWQAATKEFKKLETTSDPIGVEKTAEYKDVQISVAAGDIVILYTDGLVETLNAKGQQYGVAHLTKIISENSHLSGQEIAAKVKIDIKNFSGTTHQHDDQTLFVIKIQ